jgi:DNA-directed RNA polymerase III subunit RPC3
VEDRHGERSATVVAMLLQIGHTTVGDLISAFNFNESATTSKRDSAIEQPANHVNGNGATNGVHKPAEKEDGQVRNVAELHYILRKLLDSRFLVKVGNRSFKPQADVEAEVEDVIFNEQFPDRKITGPKKQAEFRRSVNSLKRKWREDAEYSERRDIQSNGTIHRPGMDSNAQKRQKLNGGLSNGVTHTSDSDHGGPKLPVSLHCSLNA